MNHLTSWRDVDDATWNALVERAMWHHQNPGWRQAAGGKSLGLVFFNPSLRTKTSMEIAAAQLGIVTTSLTPGTGTWGLEWRDDVIMDGLAAEHVREAFGVLSQYVDALGVRVFATLTDYEQDRDERVLKSIHAASSVPVINLESAFYHPCQALADAAALRTHHESDHSGPAGGRRFVLAWATHPKPLPMAVPNSALLMAAREGYRVTVARPPEYALDPGIMAAARQMAAASGGSVDESDDLDSACEGADVIYAKAWGGPMAYGDPAGEAVLRSGPYAGWRTTKRHVASGAFMHCLPVRRGVVVDADVLDGPRSIHLLQAGFRLHAAKAVLEGVFGGTEE